MNQLVPTAPRCFQLTAQIALALCLTLLLASCGGGAVKEPETDEQAAQTALDDIPAMLEQADQSDPLTRARLRLEAAQTLLGYGELDWARNTLGALEPGRLPDELFIDYSLLSASIAEAEGVPFRAKRYLWNERFVQAFTRSTKENRIRAREQRATLLYNIAEYRQAINERLKLDRLLDSDPDMAELNQDLLWQNLMALPLVDLQLEAQTHDEPTLKGWYSLAAISKNNQTNLRQQLRAVDNWVGRWPQHPAAQRLPADLQLLQQLVEDQPRQVALLLPLSGRLAQAAQTILDGFMAAYYQTSASGDPIPELRVYDTETDDINTLYDLAVSEGAQLIVGPLDKDRIAALNERSTLPVPTLALNYIETGESEQGVLPAGAALPGSELNASGAPVLATSNLFQFGLAVEDESQQVASQAYRDGHRRVMILAPGGSWGDRAVAAFSEQWRALGGEIIDDYRFNNQQEYSSLIEQATGVNDSKERAREMRRTIGRSFEFEPRRRQDIDLVFMVAHPSQARQLKPTLNFHYASDIPVYATSQVYNGTSDGTLNQDMNGIRFTTLPWFFDDTSPEARAVRRHGTQEAGSAYQRLYAMGVDAYHLYPRLRQLNKVEQAHYYGSTGALSLDEMQRIRREQVWAKFIGGHAHLVATAAPDDES